MTEIWVNQDHLDTLRHVVGLDTRSTPYRNRYTASEGHYRWGDLVYLVKVGAMSMHKIEGSGDTLFQLTDAGCYLLNIPGADSLK